MKMFAGISGVPDFSAEEFAPKQSDTCVLIPVLNEAGRLEPELLRAQQHGIDKLADIVVLDANSTDGATKPDVLRPLGVNALLNKLGPGKQGAQLRMGFYWALARGYDYFITIDGNNKDSIESVPLFIEKLREGYDFVQGSRYVEGGEAINTPKMRHLAVKLIHAPLISLAAGQSFTDTTNAFRGYSRCYLEHPGLQPFRDVFSGYELLAYLSVRAGQLGLKSCEVPVTRAYPKNEKTPTKISPVRGSANLFGVLIKTVFGAYKPQKEKPGGETM